jgi:predicted ferric reductase
MGEFMPASDVLILKTLLQWAISLIAFGGVLIASLLVYIWYDNQTRYESQVTRLENLSDTTNEIIVDVAIIREKVKSMESENGSKH